MLEVVAALIWRDDKFLICQRPSNKTLPFLWEFVGGKVEKGESKEQALQRECREELDIAVCVGKEYCEVTHSYPDFDVHLTLFNARIIDGEPKLYEHNDMRWITRDQIPYFEFCPADVEILKKLQENL